jgi:hypothetical protein
MAHLLWSLESSGILQMNPEPAWIFALLSRSNKTARRRGRSFVIGEQRVNVLELQGLRLRQRRIARKVAGKNGLQIVAFLSDRSNTVPDPPFFRCVAPRRFRGNGGNDRSFELPGLANEVLRHGEQIRRHRTSSAR